ncbi:hypothetical protein B0J12DRAFT_698988 [Macrophomina phaseolina]|uniref:Uncharacterized protein n=1 Tax=Macrophomina phaseolina TaxID=35725 RepID=A0ABQ8GDA6_9PEZI|nr:hypothetical protein B0J12DRAFT_698988 [Macrophomina phaseolina]
MVVVVVVLLIRMLLGAFVNVLISLHPKGLLSPFTRRKHLSRLIYLFTRRIPDGLEHLFAIPCPCQAASRRPIQGSPKPIIFSAFPHNLTAELLQNLPAELSDRIWNCEVPNVRIRKPWILERNRGAHIPPVISDDTYEQSLQLTLFISLPIHQSNPSNNFHAISCQDPPGIADDSTESLPIEISHVPRIEVSEEQGREGMYPTAAASPLPQLLQPGTRRPCPLASARLVQLRRDATYSNLQASA